MIEDMFRSKLDIEVFDFLLAHPRFDYVVSEIAEALDRSLPAIRDSLLYLERVAIIVESRPVGKGRIKLYRLKRSAYVELLQRAVFVHAAEVRKRSYNNITTKYTKTDLIERMNSK
ncbi:MAG: hypothetical protein V1934_01720 [Methanobacteriota archaeon]